MSPVFDNPPPMTASWPRYQRCLNTQVPPNIRSPEHEPQAHRRGFALREVTMTLKPCLDCGTLSTGTRCPEHQRARGRNRTQRPTNLTRTTDERKRRAAAVAAHIRTHGHWCPGYRVPAHASSDLTADHVVSVAQGGDPNGELQVMCRRCNGRKSDG